MAKPKLCLIPATIGDKVYSILPSDGVGDFDFTRADGSSPTGVTRINAQGLIEEVASGENRLNYSLLDGEVVGCPHLLLEDEATNSIPYSEDFSNSGWQKYRSSILSNNTISPDGTLNADKLVDNSDNHTHAIEERRYSLSSGSEYTYSFFAKANEIKQVGLLGSNPNQGSIFDLENGVVYGDLISAPNNSKIENFGNGWYRCSITTTLTGTDSKFGIYLAKNGSTNYSGNGTDGIYIYGAMLEEGSYPTSYIKTTSAAVTRAAETCDGSGNAATFNDSEGVLMAEISALGEDTNYELISISDGTNNSLVSIGYNNTTTESYKQVKFGVDNVFGDYTDLIDQTTFNKIAVKYKSGDSSFYVNGFEIDSSSTEFTPTSSINELKFSYFTGGDKFYGKTKQIQYFDSILDSEQLEQLTSWDSFRAMAEGQKYNIE